MEISASNVPRIAIHVKMRLPATNVSMAAYMMGTSALALRPTSCINKSVVPVSNLAPAATMQKHALNVKRAFLGREHVKYNFPFKRSQQYRSLYSVSKKTLKFRRKIKKLKP